MTSHTVHDEAIPTTAGTRRWTVGRWLALWFLPVAGVLALQGYLAFREPIFSPVDELQHTDYVRAIAEKGRLPIYGLADIDPTLLAVYMHEYPGSFSTDGYRIPEYVYISYETIQFPVYYIVSAPLYRAFDRDPRAAIYALRLENVAFSGIELLVLALILRRVLPTRPELWVLAPLAVLAMPGLTLRHSQVTNQVLAALVLTVLLASLLRQSDTRPRLAAFGEGALLGVAVLTKLTVAGIGASAVAAWATRPGGLRPRLLPAAAGFALALAPWLAWSLSVYRSPLPWSTAHVRLSFCPCPPPGSAGGWRHFLHEAWVSFVLPIEWAGPTYFSGPGYQRSPSMQIGEWAIAVLLAASLAWGIYTMGRRASTNRRTALLAVQALLGVMVGILALDLSLNRFAYTDLRELYVFAAPITLLVAGLMAGLERRLGWVLLVALLAIWLLADLQMYSGRQCYSCPPRLDWKITAQSTNAAAGN